MPGRTEMKTLSIKLIADVLEADVGAAADAPVTRINTDSRTIQPGDCFFAIVGEKFDGHAYVSKALANGAVCAVVSKPVPGDGPIVKVADTIEALGNLARWYRRQCPFKVVAITGSVGKTTTRQIIYHVLSRYFRTHQARKNFNNTIGLPLTLLETDPDHEVIVAELGANLRGEIAYLTRIARPDVAVVTNVHSVHLAGFGDLQTVAREKVSISEGLGDDGVFIVNGDLDHLLAACRGYAGTLKTFGRGSACDYRVEDVHLEPLASRFSIQGRSIRLPLPGPGNVDNALAAWAVCRNLGVSIDAFAEALESLPQVSMRAEPLHLGSLTILNDCYNASPASMANALAILKHMQADAPDEVRRRRVFICGHMAELGPTSESLHVELGKTIAQADVDLLLTVGPATEVTHQAAKERAGDRLQCEHFDDRICLCDNLERLIRPSDIILIKGSRTAQLEDVVQKLIKENQHV